MFLRRLTINGFKSFANKTVLEFEPGISAVVGPNGAGKSNVADAVRWVLGEQSVKLMRAKKGEEVIFAGTEKRAKASLAEVSLLLDNGDGGLGLDFSEIELVRRLYRSGESEYRLNGRKASLRDIQHLLIQAGFGTDSYAVIGQGMIDQLILASPAERKLLFDQASGIRGFELNREKASRKLEATDANLVRVRDILAELEPRLATLKKSATAAAERQQLADELISVRAQYITAAQSHYNVDKLAAKQKMVKLEEQITASQATVNALEQQRTDLTRPVEIKPDLSALHEQEALRDHLSNELSVKRAELQFLTEKEQACQYDYDQIAAQENTLATAKLHRQKLTQAVAEAQVAETETSARLAKVAKTIDRMQSRLASLRRQSDQTSRHEYITQALAILQQVSRDLAAPEAAQANVRLLVYKAGRLLGHASRGQAEVANDIKAAQTDLMNAMKQREDAHEPYATAVINLRSLELDMAQAEDRVAQIEEGLKNSQQLKKQLAATHKQVQGRGHHLAELELNLAATNQTVQQLRAQANQTATVQQDTAKIFRLAADLENAKANLQDQHTELSATKSVLEQIDRTLTHVETLRVNWFGNNALPEVAAQKTLPQELEHQLELLDARLNASQDNDADLLEEYQEVTQRYEFLSEQVTDLETAQLDLQTVVASLDKQIKSQFETAFAGLGRHFEAYFKQLFDGGKASLVLAPDATGSYGIDIKAVPPGKRVESLATLSGGERALTGTALLAAILTVNPSPFVVLDEIDAALDEANSSRLGQILADLAKHSQLIVITHNRQIMAPAKALYGVTMDTNHVSKVLSVRLEAAEQMAAR